MKEQNNEKDLINNRIPDDGIDLVSELDDVVFSGGSKLQSQRFVENSKKNSGEYSDIEAEYSFAEPEELCEESARTEPDDKQSFSDFYTLEEKDLFAEIDEEPDLKRAKKEQKKEPMKKWQKAVLAVLIIIFVLILALVLSVFIMHHLGKKNTMADNYGDNFKNTIVYNGVTYRYNPDVTSVAFMGVDRETFGLKDELVGTAGQSDVNMVVAINTKTGKSNVVVIPRDVYCDIDKHSHSGEYIGTETAQLCLAYSYGDGKATSCTNTVTSIQRILYGIPINTYVALNLDGVAKLNDCIGGVTLTCPNDFGEYTRGQTVTLQGEQAQAFIRNREHTVTGDENRRERQVAYVKAYVSQVAKMSLESTQTLKTVYDTGKDYTVTNLTLSRGLFFGTVILSNPAEIMNFHNIQTLKGITKEDELHYAQTVLDEKAALETVLDIYYVPEN